MAVEKVKAALGNVRTCLKMDTDKGMHWATVPSYSLGIVLDEFERLQEVEQKLKALTKAMKVLKE